MATLLNAWFAVSAAWLSASPVCVFAANIECELDALLQQSTVKTLTRETNMEILAELSAKDYISMITAPPWASKTIKEIFSSTGTDKLWRHGYHRYYEMELLQFREKASLRIMEIGADTGKSLGAWMAYFKDPAAVHGIAYGVDPVESKRKACEIIKSKCSILEIYSMDQSNKTALSELKGKNPQGWDIIVDDGSHLPAHNIISFQSLWEKIRPGGLYVIEDVETSYVENGQIYGYELHGGIGLEPPNNAVEKFKQLADVVSRKHFGEPNFTVFHGVDKDVSRVTFGDGIIFIQKKPDDADWDVYPRQLVFPNKKYHEKTLQEYQSRLDLQSDP